MADFENEEIDDLDEEQIVVMTDEEGNEYYYREEIVIPVGEKRYAILVPIDGLADEESPCDCESAKPDDGCDCGCLEETDVFIARIDTDEDGEDVYVDPTDEEFEEAREAYEKLIEEEDEAE